jgi:hypothetical protein
MNADVEWYREHLADDFVVIESDGSVLNKAVLLKNQRRHNTVTSEKAYSWIGHVGLKIW